MQKAAHSVAVAQLFGDVAGDDEQRDAARSRLAERCQGVRRPRSRCHERDAESTGGASEAVGGVCGGLLVADGDDSDPRGVRVGVVEVAPERQVVHAGKPERSGDAGVGERDEDAVGGRRAAHAGIVAHVRVLLRF